MKTSVSEKLLLKNIVLNIFNLNRYKMQLIVNENI